MMTTSILNLFSLKKILLLILLGLGSWGVFYFFTHKTFPAYAFNFSSEESIHCQIKGVYTFSESGKIYHIDALLIGKPSKNNSGITYKASIYSFDLYDTKQRLIFSYNSLSKKKFYYQVGEHLTLAERKSIYALFQVDYTKDFINEDFSILKKPLYVHLSHKGQIKELLFPIELRNKFYNFLHSSSPLVASSFIEELYSFKSFAPLFPDYFKDQALPNQWQTRLHHPIHPTVWNHEIKNKEHSQLDIMSTLEHSDNTDCKIMWSYDKLQQTPLKATLSYILIYTSNKIRKQDIYISCNMHLLFSFNFSTPVIINHPEEGNIF